jgi:hypothetical protein
VLFKYRKDGDNSPKIKRKAKTKVSLISLAWSKSSTHKKDPPLVQLCSKRKNGASCARMSLKTLQSDIVSNVLGMIKGFSVSIATNLTIRKVKERSMKGRESFMLMIASMLI